MMVESSPAHPGKNVYARPDNPTYVQAEAVIAALDGGVGCALFASGMAAACGMATALLKHGDRCVFPQALLLRVPGILPDALRTHRVRVQALRLYQG